MTTILSWNIYHGTIGGQTPMNRLLVIANLMVQNNVDILCLQEVPQTCLDTNANPFGVPGPCEVTNTLGQIPNFANNYTVLQGWSENNPNTPNSSVTKDGYLIIFSNNTFPNGYNGMDYYYAAAFKYGSTYYRPPVFVNLVDANNNITTALNWHANTGPGAAISLNCLNELIKNGVPNTYALGGDLNVRGSFNNLFAGLNFVGWTNICAFYPVSNGSQISGLDHILTSVDSGPILGNILQFTSDSYHYPIAARF